MNRIGMRPPVWGNYPPRSGTSAPSTNPNAPSAASRKPWLVDERHICAPVPLRHATDPAAADPRVPPDAPAQPSLPSKRQSWDPTQVSFGTGSARRGSLLRGAPARRETRGGPRQARKREAAAPWRTAALFGGV
eukprot:scaffold1499_cov255-Pinguiococcus_pyrenoidosus.AAC.32